MDMQGRILILIFEGTFREYELKANLYIYIYDFISLIEKLTKLFKTCVNKEKLNINHDEHMLKVNN